MLARPVLVLFGFLLALANLQAEDWPGWRGPTGQGQSAEKNLPLKWDGKSGENIRWKVPLVPENARTDQNQSSPIVIGDRVIVTVSYWPAGVEAKGNSPEHHVLCHRADDGNLLWDSVVPAGPWRLTDLRGGYTAPTPASDGERIYVAFGSAVLAALDREGKLIWRKEIAPHDFDVAMAVSPVVVGENVVFVCDFNDAKKSRLLAFDRKTGELRWDKSRAGQGFCHSTPVLANYDGKPTLLVAGAGSLQGVHPETGEMMWSVPAKGDTVSPVVGAGLVYLDSGRGGAGVALDAKGPRWKIDRLPEGFSSPIVVGEYLYRLCSPSTLRCIKMSDGSSVYQQRLEGASTSSSPIATADGRIYCVSAGKSFVLQAGPEFTLLATNDLGDASHASPAIAGGRLVLKGAKYLYCIGK